MREFFGDCRGCGAGIEICTEEGDKRNTEKAIRYRCPKCETTNSLRPVGDPRRIDADTWWVMNIDQVISFSEEAGHGC